MPSTYYNSTAPQSLLRTLLAGAAPPNNPRAPVVSTSSDAVVAPTAVVVAPAHVVNRTPPPSILRSMLTGAAPPRVPLGTPHVSNLFHCSQSQYIVLSMLFIIPFALFSCLLPSPRNAPSLRWFATLPAHELLLSHHVLRSKLPQPWL
jgi:hypothetical protein